MRKLESSFVSTMVNGRFVKIFYRPLEDEIPHLIKMGAIPIELSYENKNFVDDLKLNHHNSLAHQDASSILSLAHYDVASKKNRSILVNRVDADCVMAGINILGLLPKEICEKVSPYIGMRDMDPFNSLVQSSEWNTHISTWNYAMSGQKNDAWAWLFGAQLMCSILEHPENWSDRFEQQRNLEESRLKLAAEDYENNGTILDSGKVVLISPSRAFGFDIQFQRREEFSNVSLAGWKHWVIVSYVEKLQKVTVSCPNVEVAEAIFGKGGLTNVFPKLKPVEGKEWGGRAAIGGSPREFPIAPEEVEAAAMTINEMVKATMG